MHPCVRARLDIDTALVGPDRVGYRAAMVCWSIDWQTADQSLLSPTRGRRVRFEPGLHFTVWSVVPELSNSPRVLARPQAEDLILRSLVYYRPPRNYTGVINDIAITRNVISQLTTIRPELGYREQPGGLSLLGLLCLRAEYATECVVLDSLAAD